MTGARMAYHGIVLGAGINGLSAAYHWRRLGGAPLAVVEQFPLRHERGSSHGFSRITRSTYAQADYVRLMQHVHAEEWPRLESDLGRRLIHPNPGCFFGPPGPVFDQYVRAVREAGAAVDLLDVAEARRVFPAFRFDRAAGVLRDRTSGVIAASEVIAGLIEWLGTHGVDLRDNTRVNALEIDRDPIRVMTSRGVLETERLIVCGGAWVTALVPELAATLQVARQTVAYIEMEGAPELIRVGHFPVWVHLSDRVDECYYGLPEFGRPGLKLARHLTAGRDDVPDEIPSSVDPIELERLRAFLTRELTLPVRAVAGAEFCLYTNAPNEDFILDLHPANRNVAVGSACSGHGFKFGPLSGRVLVELLLRGATTLPEFESRRSRFRFPGTPAG